MITIPFWDKINTRVGKVKLRAGIPFQVHVTIYMYRQVERCKISNHYNYSDNYKSRKRQKIIDGTMDYFSMYAVR